MAGRIDSASAGAEIVNAYDSQIDSLMDAISSYVGRDTFSFVGRADDVVREPAVGESVHISTETGRMSADGVAITRQDDNSWTDEAGNSYAWNSDRGRFVGLNVNVGGRNLDAATVEDPGFGLLSAAAVNDGTSNIGLATKLIMDQAGWAKQVSRATQG